MYHYKARAIKVVDGDTVDLTVDVGFYMRFDGRFRLDGIDTPERGHDHYAAAKNALRAMVMGKELDIYTAKAADKYGRFLVRIFEPGSLVSVNDTLVGVGLAVVYDGGKKET